MTATTVTAAPAAGIDAPLPSARNLLVHICDLRVFVSWVCVRVCGGLRCRVSPPRASGWQGSLAWYHPSPCGWGGRGSSGVSV